MLDIHSNGWGGKGQIKGSMMHGVGRSLDEVAVGYPYQAGSWDGCYWSMNDVGKGRG